MPKKKGMEEAAPASAETTPVQATAKPKSAKAVSTEDLKPAEIEKRIIELVNQGFSASEIGRQLRDQNGILSTKVSTGKTIGQILKGHRMAPEIPEDLMALIRRVVVLDAHMIQNKKDFAAKRGYQLTVSKIRRLVRYYHEKKRLPVDWRYSLEKARLLVK